MINRNIIISFILLYFLVFEALAYTSNRATETKLLALNSVDEIEVTSNKNNDITAFYGEYTSTFQGLESGGHDQGYEYGGKIDVFVKVDTSQLGLWQGGTFHSHVEYRHGKASNNSGFLGGALWPVNTALALPLGAHEELEASSLYLNQRLEESSSILVGKINVLDLLAKDKFFGGWGNRRFMHVAFVAPPSGVLPPTIFGAIINKKTKSINWTAMLFDPNDRTTDYLPDDLFSDGVNFSLSGASSRVFLGRESSASLGVVYSTKRGKDLSGSMLPSNLASGTKKGSYSLSLQLYHALFPQDNDNGRDWGLFMKASLADGNPNPIKASVISGISGNALFSNRKQDSFGLGYFYYAFSDELTKNTATSSGFDDEHGIEMFYSYTVADWFHVTTDIQFIDPARVSYDKTLILGLRTNIRF